MYNYIEPKYLELWFIMYARAMHNGEDMSNEPGDEYPSNLMGIVVGGNGNNLWILS